MVIRSDSGLIRYNVDYLNHTITLLEAQFISKSADGTTIKLEDNLPIGASAVVVGENVRINFPYPFAVTQSPDARLITITRGDLQVGNLGPSDPRVGGATSPSNLPGRRAMPSPATTAPPHRPVHTGPR